MVFRLVVVFFFFSLKVFSQENYTQHKVSKGENITVIAKKYGLKPAVIIAANPSSSKILKLNSVLLIPIANTATAAKTAAVIVPTTAPILHEVLAKETLWRISKKYKVSIEELKEANPRIETEGLKKGQQITIPSKPLAVVETPVSTILPDATVEITRTVLPRETKFGIAKEFDITVRELEKQNPKIKAKLLVGDILKIKISKEKAAVLQLAEITTPIREIQLPNDDASTTAAIEEKNNLEALKYSSATEEFKDQLVRKATANIGVRYRYGGTSKKGFDCSGLMCNTFESFDIKLPRTSIEQSQVGSIITPQQAQKGDLIFFKTAGKRRINHVGMVVEVLGGEIKFVHASAHGVMVSSTKEGYYERAFSQVNRVLQ